MGYIYKITNQINGKVYIGQTNLSSVQDRFNAHVKKANRHVNRYLYDAMNHYGVDNFSVEEIEHCDKEKLDDREIFWISHYKSNNKDFGYNMTAGGGGGDTWTNNPRKEETVKKSKETKIRNGTYGKAMPKGTISPNIGKYKVDIDSDELLADICDFMSIEDLCEKYGVPRRILYLRCQRYFSMTPTELRGDRLTHTNTRHIDIDKDKLLDHIQNNKTIAEIAQLFNVSKETIRRRIFEYFNKSIKELKYHVDR